MICRVSPIRNSQEIKVVGALIRKLRIEAGFSLDDIAHMTSISQGRLSSIENGANTTIAVLMEIAKAIGVQPMRFFDHLFVLKPRYKLPANRQERKRLTERVIKLSNTDFFDEPRFVREVVAFLNDEYSIEVESFAVSNVLSKIVAGGRLRFELVGRQKRYKKVIN